MNSCYSTTLRLLMARRSAAITSTLANTRKGTPLVVASPEAPSESVRWMSAQKNKNRRTNKAISGNRGSRGHGWYVKYREGRGGRHLQGEYWDRKDHHWDMQQWNDAVLSLGSQFVYLDIAVEPPAANAPTAAAAEATEDSQEEKNVDVQAAAPSSAAAEVKPLSTERLIFQIASTVMPETCINFVGLCQDAAYKGTILYRIEKEVGICGGDVLTNTGKFGQCLQEWPYESSKTAPSPRMNPLRRDLPPPEDEPMALWHTAGTVTMLCPKVNEIDSRFILCGKNAPHLDGIHRAFGKMEPESLKIVQQWQDSVLTSYGKPKSVTLRIVDCGLLENYQSNTTGSSTKEAPASPQEVSSSA